MDEQSEIDPFGKIVIRIRLTNSKYNNIVHAKRLTLSDHGLFEDFLPLSQCAPETKSQVLS